MHRDAKSKRFRLIGILQNTLRRTLKLCGVSYNGVNTYIGLGSEVLTEIHVEELN